MTCIIDVLFTWLQYILKMELAKNTNLTVERLENEICMQICVRERTVHPSYIFFTGEVNR